MKGFLSRIVRACPALPYLALGAWLAAAYLVSSGTVWLSDTEMDGTNLSTLFVASTIASGLVMLLATFFAPRVRIGLARPRAAVAGGVLASLGAAIVIAIGPYYLTPVLPQELIEALFVAGGVMMGAGLAAVGLRCGHIYGSLPPRRVIVYACFSHVMVALFFFIVVGAPSWAPVPGGPSLVGILAFVGLPLAAGALASLASFLEPSKAPACAESRAALPKSFWKLLAVVLVFSVIAYSVRAVVVDSSPVDVTLDGTRAIMLLRMVTALALACVAVGTSGDKPNFGKIYSIVMVVSVALVAMLPLVAALRNVLSQTIMFASFVFELLLWCVFAFIAYQRRMSAVLVFGYGWGTYLLGSGLGWALGAQALTPLIDRFGPAAPYMLMALVVLACAFVIFSEREFDQLFVSDDEGAPTLDELMRQEFAAAEGEGKEGSPKKGRFGQAIESLAEEHRLSPRETDVLRCLAMGYDSGAVAKRLQVSWNTVRTHTRNVYAKLDVHSRQEIIDLVDQATKRL